MTRGRRRTDRWVWRSPSNLSVAVLFLSVCFLFGLLTYVFVDVNGRAGHDEVRSCRIQARALPAAHELVAVMADIHALLTVPLTAQQRRQQRAERPQVRRLVADLNRHLAAYTALEARQPRTRHC